MKLMYWWQKDSRPTNCDRIYYCVTLKTFTHLSSSKRSKEGGADGELVASSQLNDLTGVAEGCCHDRCRVAVVLEVLVDLGHRDDARVLMGRKFSALFGLVPIHDAPHERADERSSGISTGHRLRTPEHSKSGIGS